METFIVEFFDRIRTAHRIRLNRDSRGRFIAGNEYQIRSIPTVFGPAAIMPNGFSSLHCKWVNRYK